MKAKDLKIPFKNASIQDVLNKVMRGLFLWEYNGAFAVGFWGHVRAESIKNNMEYFRKVHFEDGISYYLLSEKGKVYVRDSKENQGNRYDGKRNNAIRWPGSTIQG